MKHNKYYNKVTCYRKKRSDILIQNVTYNIIQINITK